MCANQKLRRKSSGMTLVELIVFIVIVSVALVGTIGVMNVTSAHNADPIITKKSEAMADSIIEEVLSRAFLDPDGASGEASREVMDDVFDYNYFDGSLASKKILGSQLLGGSTSPLPDTYWAKVVVITTTFNGQTLAKVTVTVTNPDNKALTFTGYKGNYS